VRALFHHGAFGADDVGATAQALALLALGLPAQVAVKTLAAAFFARGDTGTPLIATLAAVVVALIGALALAPWFGVAGIALALAASAWVAASWLGVRAVRDGHLAIGAAVGALARIALASVVMGGALATARALWPPPAHAGAAVLQLALFIAGGIALYGALLVALGVVDRNAATALRNAIARGKDGASNDPSRTFRHGDEA